MTIHLLGREITVKREIVAISAVLIIIIAGIIGYSIERSGHKIIIDAESDKAGKEEISIEKDEQSGTVQGGLETQEPVEEIKVYVVGCVKNPGIVTLKKGDLINDAIIAAGGADEDADLENINLVYKLTSNAMLRIRSRDEVRKDSGKGSEAGTGVSIETGTGSGAVVISNEGNGSNNNDGKININTATIDELDTLPGIGKATAREIVDYREKNGNFKDITDIMKVPGIKEGRFNNIKDLITVD
ncbi:MAG TPA: competence protein ComEA [Clostridiaceae bacterium]|nr:competence protein ComEA [Clostridiaceae bacterium]